MLYIHIPYCKGKCIYCDFYSGGNPDWKKYLKAVASELGERIEELGGDCLSSLYIGGGTPSLIPSADFINFMETVHKMLEESGITCQRNIEMTIEVNPEDVTEQKALAWKTGGINRISMGVQSLNDRELKFLKRRHSSERVETAIKILKRHFNNISLDIIYGIPGQSEESLKETIDKLLSFGIQHISAYALTYEEHTPLEVLRKKGWFKACSEDEYIEFDEIVSNMLEKAGYTRYEISNYAISGFHSRHNTGYWKGKPYLGIGPSAASYDGQRRRRSNKADLKAYLEGTNLFSEEILNDEELLEEKIMVELRVKDGIDLLKIPSAKRDNLLKKAQSWIDDGYLKYQGDHLALTRNGIKISDFIILDLIP